MKDNIKVYVQINAQGVVEQVSSSSRKVKVYVGHVGDPTFKQIEVLYPERKRPVVLEEEGTLNAEAGTES